MFIQICWIAALLTGTIVHAQTGPTGFPDPVCFRRGSDGRGTTGARECSQFINAFCDNAASIRPTNVGDSVSLCFNLSGNRRCDFVALNSVTNFGSFGGNQNGGGGGGPGPNEGTCTRVLNDIVSRCTDDLGGGGGNAPQDYTYSIDPNTGPCSWGVQGGN